MLIKILYYILGISLWFPSFSIATIGDKTGIQMVLIISVFIFVLQGLITNFSFRKNYLLLFIYIFWVLGISLSALVSDDKAAVIRGIISYCSVLFVFYSIASTPFSKTMVTNSILKGFIVGGVLSSFYAVYQYFGFKFSLPYTTLLNNNPSFSSYANFVGVQHKEVLRAFGFTPEPSVFSALLISALFVNGYLYQKSNAPLRKYTNYLILLMGLVVSGSMSFAISIPLIFILMIILNATWRKKVFSKFKKGSFLIVPFIIIFSAFLFIISPINNSLDFNILDRIKNIENDNSFIVRSGAMLASFNIFLEHPITGYGLNSMGPAYEEYMPSYVKMIEDKKGVDSLPLAILAEQGIFSFLGLTMMFIVSLVKTRNNPHLYLLILSLLVTFSIQTPYIYLYHLWVFLGIGFLGIASHNTIKDSESNNFQGSKNCEDNPRSKSH